MQRVLPDARLRSGCRTVEGERRFPDPRTSADTRDSRMTVHRSDGLGWRDGRHDGVFPPSAAFREGVNVLLA